MTAPEISQVIRPNSISRSEPDACGGKNARRRKTDGKMHSKWSANLSGAKLTGVLAGNADFSDAIMSNVNMMGADLRDAKMEGADLSGAKIGGANLHGAQLKAAILTGVDLSNLKERDADLSEVITTSTLGVFCRPANLLILSETLDQV